MTNEDDYIDIHPWPIPELAGRLVASVAVGRRGLIESDVDSDPFERETDRFELDAWAKLELSPWIQPVDLRILESPIGSLTDDQRERCDSSLLVASSIAWALNVFTEQQLPILSDSRPEQRALEWAPGPWTPLRNVIKAIRIRNDDILAAERERWELIHWRSALFEDPTTLAEDATALEDTVREIAEQGLFPTTAGDFALEDGSPFGELPEEIRLEIRMQSEVRLRALNWVCGFGESVDAAPLFIDE